MLRYGGGGRAMTMTETAHVWLDDSGVAWIDRTNTKVIEVVLDSTAYGLSPAEIHREHPHLALAQIHAALAYYYDHQQEVDEDIERRYQEAEALRVAAGESPVRKRLEQMGLLP